MKPPSVSMFVAVTAVCLATGRTSLHAQPAGDTIVVEGDDKPWNHGVPIATRREARDLFLEGNRLFKLPLFAQAAEQYTAALNKWKHPAFYFNLALAELNLGQDVEARDHLSHALDHGAEGLDPGRLQEARKQREDLEHRLGRIHVSCQTDGAEVTLDGVTLFTGPGSQEVWVKAKGHEVTAKRPDYLSEARRVTVASGEIKKLELKLITLSEAAEAGRRWAVWKPWAVVGAGGAVAVSALVFRSLAARDFSSYDGQFSHLPCAQGAHPRGCTASDPAQLGQPNLNALLKKARQEQAIAIGGYIASGSLIATGIVLLYLNRPRLLEQEPTSTSTGNIAVVPMISSDMLGILMYVSH